MEIINSSLSMSSTHALTQKYEASEALVVSGATGRVMATAYGLGSGKSAAEKAEHAERLGGALVQMEHATTSQTDISSSSVVSISTAGQAAAGANTAKAAAMSADEEKIDPKIRFLIQAVEKMTGRKIHIVSTSALIGQTPSAGNSADAAAAPAANRAAWGVRYDSHESYSEAENTSFSANGTVKTADGQEINFQLNLSMSRSYTEENNVSVRLGDAKLTDPLVLNFNGNAAELSDTTFSFDLNNDGSKEQIHQLQSGSAYLALDRNHDGQINNGSELFGTASGNGFADLAQYDGDGNGWIDENDTVFNQLEVWGADGSLQSLQQADVGAISLQNQATSFYLKNGSNDTQGQIVSSGVFLKESGGVGSVQQVDLAV